MPGSYARGRSAAAGLALLLAAAALAVGLRGSARPTIGRHSVATIAATAALAAAAAMSGRLALQREAAWSARSAWWHARRHAVPRNLPGGAFALALALAAVVHAACAWRSLAANTAARDDQADYLRVANEVAGSGGAGGLPGALLRGEHREDNRHPLYVAALALRPDFAWGKALAGAGGVATVAAAAWIALRRDGRLAAATTALLLAGNGALHESAALVACETWLALLVLLGWERLGGTSAARHAAAGAWLGLAYLSKASAAFLAVLAALTAWRRPRAAAALLVAFAAVASPLLVRNARVYGNPLHSFNNKLLFADSFEAGRDLADLGLRGNFARWRETHSWSDGGKRLATGLAWEGFVLARALGPTGLDSLRAPLGAAVWLLALAGMWLSPDRRWLVLLLWTAWFWGFFGWYQPIAAGDRFVLPLAAPLALAAGAGVARLTGQPSTAVRL